MDKETVLIPYVNKNYKCLTCGSESGESNPLTSYCWHCDTDNWKALDNDHLR